MNGRTEVIAAANKDLRHSLSGEEFSDNRGLQTANIVINGLSARSHNIMINRLASAAQADEYKAVYQYIKTRISGSVLEADFISRKKNFREL
jgi:hypothetical protein